MSKLWTKNSYIAHNEAMRKMDEKLQNERDKRYTEGNQLRAMALQIKETADFRALELARELQTYKDERNDAMREQNLKETGVFATRDDLANIFSKTEEKLTSFIDEMKIVLKPVLAHIAEDKGAAVSTTKLYAGIAILVILIELGFKIFKF